MSNADVVLCYVHSVFLWQFNLYFCAISFGILALFWLVFLLHKIYGAQIGAFVNDAVEVGEKLAELRDG